MIDKLQVRLTFAPDRVTDVGTLVKADRRVMFEFHRTFLDSGPEISPYRLPKRPGLHENREREAGSLPGVFDDSLPDGWGMLLMDRAFRGRGVDLSSVSALDRLALVGHRGMGALTYHPADEWPPNVAPLQLTRLVTHAEEVLEGRCSEVLPELVRLGGSPGGARPKILVGLRNDEVISGDVDVPEGYEPWIIKLAAPSDLPDAGPVEFAYAQMAGAAGITMEPTRLVEVDATRRYFAVRRFDRSPGSRRRHMHTFGNLIHANFRVPGNDYQQLLKVTLALTRNHADVLRAFRQIVFNIAAHNRDDHVKNFAFIMSPDGEWALSPGFDITHAPGPGGEHTMTVLGEGRSPGRSHCLDLAIRSGIRKREAEAVFEQVDSAVARWAEFADAAGCTRGRAKQIARSHRRMGT